MLPVSNFHYFRIFPKCCMPLDGLLTPKPLQPILLEEKVLRIADLQKANFKVFAHHF